MCLGTNFNVLEHIWTVNMIYGQSAKRAALNEWDNVVSTAQTCRKLWRNLIFESPTSVTAFWLVCLVILPSLMPSLASRLRQSLSFLRTWFLRLRPYIYIPKNMLVLADEQFEQLHYHHTCKMLFALLPASLLRWYLITWLLGLKIQHSHQPLSFGNQ